MVYRLPEQYSKVGDTSSILKLVATDIYFRIRVQWYNIDSSKPNTTTYHRRYIPPTMSTDFNITGAQEQDVINLASMTRDKHVTNPSLTPD
jgi:hypothetical protein